MQSASFVTGLPGLLARTLIETLLAGENAHVIALVPAGDRAAVEAFARRLPSEQRVRLELVDGNPTAIDLGFAGPEYVPFANRLGTIYHAHEARFGTAAREAVREQLSGTREAIALAKAGSQLPLLVFFSTALVAGDRKGTMPEEELDARRDFGAPVVEARARAEKMVRAASSSLPTLVLRPTLLTGHSETGELVPLTPFAELLAALVDARRSSSDARNSEFGQRFARSVESSRKLHVVPVDWVAKVATVLATVPQAHGRTVHVADDRALSYEHLVDLVARATARPARSPREGSPLSLLPRNLKEAFFTTPGFERFAENPKLFGWWLSGPSSFSRANLVRFLGDQKPPCPAFESYVERLILVKEEARRSMMPPKPSVDLTEAEDPLA